MRNLVFFVIFLTLAGLVYGDSLVLQPDSAGKDSQLTSNSPDTNWGTRIYLTDNWGAVATRGIVTFEGLSAIPTGSTINSAVLQLYSQYNTPNDQFGIYRCTADWVESTITWNNQPAHYATAYASTLINGPGYFTWDVKTLVQEWVTGTYPNYGFKIIRATEAAGSYPYFCSSDNTTADWRPKLTVDYTPNTGIAPSSLGRVKALYH